MKQRRRPRFSYKEETHEYFLDGVRLFGLTETLSRNGLIDARFFTEKSSYLGQDVHNACHYLDEGDLDWSSLSRETTGFVRGYERFKRESGFIVQASEERLYSAKWGVGCRLDKRGLLRRARAIVEIKTGTSGLPGTSRPYGQIQTAIQALCLPRPHRRYVLELRRGGRYKLHPCNDPEDLVVAKSLLYLGDWKRRHGYR